jgi:hypothetical protein
MDRAALRAAQQPFKDAYREDPQQAVVTMRAQGELGARQRRFHATDGVGTVRVTRFTPDFITLRY